MKTPQLAPLRKQSIPFDDPDWIYEIKHDGFRALGGDREWGLPVHLAQATAVYRILAAATCTGKEVKARIAILDGELVVADPFGRTVFASLMKRERQVIRYFAFDLVWLNGQDLRAAFAKPQDYPETDPAGAFPTCPLCRSYEGERPLAI